MKIWLFDILNHKEATKWSNDNGYKIDCKNTTPIDLAVKSGALIEIDKEYFATTIAKNEKTDTTWILDEIWKLTDEEMKENDLYFRYRYKAHVVECPDEYDGVKAINAGFSFN